MMRTGLAANVEKIYFPGASPPPEMRACNLNISVPSAAWQQDGREGHIFQPSPAPAQFAFRILGLTVQ